MTTEHAYVWVYLPGAQEPVPAGKLAISTEGRDVWSRFFFGERYLEHADRINLDPVNLELRSGDQFPRNDLDLFGIFRDAAPDSWGRFLIEKRTGRSVLTEMEYLLHAGGHRVGALEIGLDVATAPPSGSLVVDEALRLEELVEAVGRIDRDEPADERVELLLRFGSSMGGARPKTSLILDGEFWIAKLPRRDDRFNIPRIEYATLVLAERCGLDVPERRLESTEVGDVLLVRRFDRVGSTHRHFMSGLTALTVHESESSRQSYAQLGQVIRRHAPRDHVRADLRELFARIVFNIACNNCDDHLRNHGFLHVAGDAWRLSPLYDVMPQPQAGETYRLALACGPYRREATVENAVEGAGQLGIAGNEAAAIVARVLEETRQWRQLFSELGVCDRDLPALDTCFRQLSLPGR